MAIKSVDLTIIGFFGAPILYNKPQTTHGSRTNLLTQVSIITKESFLIAYEMLIPLHQIPVDIFFHGKMLTKTSH